MVVDTEEKLLKLAETAKQLAEITFKTGQIAMAKIYALKAQKYFPKLNGIDATLRAYEVHLAAAHEIDQQPDWYGILGVPRSADTETIKKRYKKTAALVHPDKNSSAAAEGAFKLITEAKNILLDAIQKRESDLKKKNKKKKQGTTTTQVPPTPQCHRQHEGPSHPPSTFWTMCSWCEEIAVLDRMFVGIVGLCKRCNREFVMVDGDVMVRRAAETFGWRTLKCRWSSMGY